jgi:hypothetical protein
LKIEFCKGLFKVRVAGKKTPCVLIIILKRKERGMGKFEISFVQNFGVSICVRSVGTLAIFVKQRCAV